MVRSLRRRLAMTLSLRPEHLKRYRDVGRLLMKYGRSDLVRRAGLDGVLEASDRRNGSSG